MDIVKSFKTINRRYIYAIAGFAVVVAIISLAYFLTLPENKLSPSDRKAFVVIKNNLKRKDIKFDETLISDGDWKLIKLSSTAKKDTDNSVLFILKGEKIKMSGTFFSPDEMIDRGVPDKIIRYLHKGTIWLNYHDYDLGYPDRFDKYFKPIIQIYANNNNIKLDRVKILKDSTFSKVDNPRENNRTEYNEFKFKINNNPDSLTLENIITMEDGNMKVVIRDKDNKELISYTYKNIY